ncbi:dihydroorotase family protein [Bartonella sp. DGB1]|uniref:dihydroorotase n=1 Tax=Bartonella sp. DGB1 TaxID=3239807 RepID=UPI0035249B83
MSTDYTLILHNAHIIDPSKNINGIGSIYIKGAFIDKITQGETNIEQTTKTNVINLKGKYIIPSLVATHVKINKIDKQTFSNLENMALNGGISDIIISPQFLPEAYQVETIELLQERVKTAKVNFHFLAPITNKNTSKNLAEIGLLTKAGAVGFDTGDLQLDDASLMLQAMSYIKDFNQLICITPQNRSLTTYGYPNDCLATTLLGLTPNNELAEIIALERDLRIAEATQTKLHVAQISTKKSVEIIRNAKEYLPELTAAVSIEHLSFNELDLRDYNNNLKLSIPLRSENDRQALISGLKNNIINIISSHHVSYTTADKRTTFAKSPVGTANLDILLPATLRLYHDGYITLPRLVELISTNPAKIFNIKGSSIDIGERANMIILDTEKIWRFSPTNAIDYAYVDAAFFGYHHPIISGNFVNEQSISELKND